MPLTRPIARLRRLAALGLAAGLAPLTLGAQVAPDTSVLQPVVVTATRAGLAQAVPTTSSTVITGDEMRARGIVSLADALRDVPGATPVQTGSFGGLTSLFLRGGQSDYVKVLVDGVPVNAPGGGFTFENLTTANIDRIEIIRGPASVLYGTDAVTGVIQIFTKHGTGLPNGSIAANGGSYTSVNGSAEINGGVGKLGYSAGGVRESTNGILPFNNRYTNGEASGRLDWGNGTPTAVSLVGRYHTSDYHFPTLGDGTPVDHNQYRRDEGHSLAFDAGHIFDRIVAAHLALTANSDDASNINPPDGGAADTGVFATFNHDVNQRLGADAHVDAHITPAVVVTVGGSIEGQSDRSRSSDAFNFPPSPPFPADSGSSATAPTAHFRRVGAGYAEIVGNVGSQASYTAGARVDDNSAFGTYGTYRVSGGYAVGFGGQLHAALGTAFKDPTFEQNFSATPFDSGNVALRPEHSLGWEVGITEAPFGQGLSVSATYFAQQFRDIIDYTPTAVLVSGTTQPTNFVNIAGANASGIELGMIAGPVDGTSLILSYTGLHTRVTQRGADTSGTSQFPVGARLIRRPAHQFSGTFRHALAIHGSIAATARYVGTRDDIDFASGSRVVLPGYTTVDLAGDFRLFTTGPGGPSFSLTARAINLLNRHYDEIATYAAPGRTVLVGGRIDLVR